MTLVRRGSPFSDLVTLRNAMDRLFDDRLFRTYTAYSGSEAELGRLPLDVRSTPDALLIQAALPGMTPDDVEITVENGTLSIKAEDRTPSSHEDGDWLVREISRGGVMRTVTLPTGLEPDKAEATFEHGILKLRIPKADQVKPRQIQVRPISSGESKRVETGAAAATGSAESPRA